jgi:hypothetical protein
LADKFFFLFWGGVGWGMVWMGGFVHFLIFKLRTTFRKPAVHPSSGKESVLSDLEYMLLYDRRLWAGLIWLGIGTGGGLL